MRKITLFVIFLILNLRFFVVIAQTPKIDSLENLLQQNTKEDTTRVNLLNETAYNLYSIDLEKLLMYAQEAEMLADEIGFDFGKAESLRIVAIYYSIKANNPKAIEYYKKSLVVSEKIEDRKGISSCYGNLGIVYSNQGEYSKALEYYRKSMQISSELGDKERVSRCNINIAVVYLNQGDYSKALEYYQKALEIIMEIGDKRDIAILYGNIGEIYYEQGYYPQALEYYQKSLKISEELGDKRGISFCYRQIGIIYFHQEDYTKALKYYQESLTIAKKLDDKKGITNLYVNIGEIYSKQNDYSKAFEYLEKCLIVARETGAKNLISWCLMAIGNNYREQGDYTEAMEYYRESLKMSIEIGFKLYEAECYVEIGSLYLIQKKTREAYIYSKNAYLLSTENGFAEILKRSSEILAKSSETLALYKEAYKYHVVFKNMNDSLYNEENTKKITAAEYQYKYEKEKKIAELEQQKKDAVQAEEAKQQKTIRNLFIAGFILMLILALVILRSFIQKRKANRILAEQKQKIEDTNEQLNQANEELNSTNEELNTTLEMVKQQKEEISFQKTEIEVQRDTLSKQNIQITDSINYANRIQQAALPSKKSIKKILPEHFIFFKPRDIVSGDFYWVNKIDDKIIVAVADCTGHGVPGAFMSMLGISFLNQIVSKEEVMQPNQVLEKLRKQVKSTLDQTGEKYESKDGMDIAFCEIDTKTNKLQFAGANNSLYIIRNKELKVLKPDHQPIGINIKEKTFTNHKFQLQKHDTLYMFSDGYYDQFGGEHDHKFLSSRFKELLISVNDKILSEQKQILEQTFNDWRGNSNQIDDVLVMGIQIDGLLQK